MDKRKLIARTAAKSKYSKQEVREIANLLLDTIFETLQQGEEICINGFGKFEPKVCNSYTRRNAKTKKPIYIPEKISILFTGSRKFKPLDGVLEKIKAQKEENQ